MLAAAVAALAQLVARAADEQCEGPGQPDSWPRLWGGVQRGLGAYQPPRHPIADYADYTELVSAAQHFHRRGVSLGRDLQHDEALRAFQRASVEPLLPCPCSAALCLGPDAERPAQALEPSDAAHWNNVGVALLRQGDGKAALAALGRALRLDPENRLASLNQQLAAAVSELRVGGNLDALPGRGDWCTDDDSAVVRLTDGRFPGCTAAVAAMAGHRHARGGRERAVCLLCPSACGLCPAPAAWSDRWWAPPAKEDSGPLPTRCTIERRSADSMTAASFAREFGRRRVPVMLTGLADHWALQRWLNASDPPAHADADLPRRADDDSPG